MDNLRSQYYSQHRPRSVNNVARFVQPEISDLRYFGLKAGYKRRYLIFLKIRLKN